MLSTLKIKSARPDSRPYKLADSGGLYLLVQPSGSKLWRYKFRVAGKEGLQSLGSFPEVGLAEARGQLAESRQLVSQGINPTHARREQRLEQEHVELVRVTDLFSTVVADWSSATGAGLRPATVKQCRREIDNDLLPKLKGRHISSITRLELTALLKRVETRAPEVARNLRNHLWGIFEYAIDSGLLEANPVPPVRVMRKRNQKNHAALSEERLGAFLRAIDDPNKMKEETSIAMRLVLLTACRKAEVIEGQWKEIDLDNAQWEIPAARMKGNRPHWIPLSRQAVELIRRLRQLVPADRDHLFPNRDDPKCPMANRSLNAVMERLGFGGEGTPHGMRAAFSTYFNSIEQNIDVIEQCLAHVPSNAVRAAYNRHAYRPERRAILQQWAERLEQLRAHVPVTSKRHEVTDLRNSEAAGQLA
ncbi:tyrosine-type recombinase/integrase [Diaphorobacter aerolatus]|uniref:Tyrosine-type recombinase/integrase n=1 Tax=Diaphorobacter aerolatus TaxID=1288495 RepID=A0A7H0GIP0_9BURK|nr:integrase arm-type DNA-binding domain-containing protein [Diaphorobacter aerolatus]QNP48156.1 tyrosine-type recombinase/integrase [Diaphorobacter aerolatus]